MTLQALRCFLAVAESGSFTLAAARIGIAQPSLSEQIRQLERSLKARLFDRLHRKVLLTAAGHTVLPHALQVVAALESLRGVVEHQADEVRGPLILAATPTLAPFIVASAVAKFVKKHPKVELAVHEMPAKQIVEQVKARECDLGFVALAVENPQILIEPLFSESLVVALPKRHRLARKSAIKLGDLASESLILLDELREIAGPLLSKSRGDAGSSIVGVGLQLATIETLVAAGAGICLLPAMARNTHSQSGIVYRPIEAHAPVRTVSAIWHRDRVRLLAAQRFMQTLRDVITSSF